MQNMNGEINKMHGFETLLTYGRSLKVKALNNNFSGFFKNVSSSVIHGLEV